MYQRLEFGPDAKAFVRLRLSEGPLLARLLWELPLEWGRVVAFLPLTPGPRELIHFIERPITPMPLHCRRRSGMCGAEDAPADRTRRYA